MSRARPACPLPARAAFLLVVLDDREAARIAAATEGAVHLGGWDVPPLSGRRPSAGCMARRLDAVARIDTAKPRRVVASLDAVLAALPPAELAARTVAIEPGSAVTELCERLTGLGLAPVSRADRPGTFAAYGRTLDVWSAAAAEPVRVRFDADVVTAIEPFDPATMRCAGSALESVVIVQHAANPDPDGGASDDPHLWPVHWDRRTILDAIGDASVLFAEGVEDAGNALVATIDDEHAERLVAGGHVPPRSAWLESEEWDQLVAQATTLDAKALDALAGGVAAAAPAPARALSDELLAAGDLVVHLHHGVGAYRGIETVEVDGHPRDAFRIEFADGTLAVLAREAHLIWRYGEREGRGRALDKMGDGGWLEGLAGIATEVEATAAALLDRRAALERVSAPRIAWGGPLLDRCAGSGFEPTPDQRRAFDDIAADMAGEPEADTSREGGKVRPPMDRLLCGDTGFGKTEVILRAALATVEAGHQALVAAPTVLLVEQHRDVMERRLRPLGVEVRALDGTVPEKERSETYAMLESGKPVIVVGTHLLATEAVRPASLGLLVLDEEQRFGADVKNALRAKGEAAHVLATTATPIPRTLLGALVGLRSVSTLGAPPPGRRGSRTEAHDWDEPLLRRALERETGAGGRAFVVVPRVADMDAVEEGLARIVPPLRVARLHGKMDDDAMMAALDGFRNGETDVLLATSVIETGIDVPDAALMVILDAGRFGLSQLHQLRGRVGRGARAGRTLLFADCAWTGAGAATPAAWDRLRLLELHDGPGAGFAIAEHDREQRGGGELFGEAQTGHADRLGLELSARLLREALDGTLDLEAFGADASLALPGARLPCGYVPQEDVRARLYARLSKARDAAEVEAMAAEIADRFGPPPEPARAFLSAARVTARARALGVRGIVAGPDAVAMAFGPDRAAALKRRVGGEAVTWKGDRLLVRSTKAEPGRSEAVLDAVERSMETAERAAA